MCILYICVCTYVCTLDSSINLRILSGQHTHEWVRLSGNHLLSQNNHILIAVVKDVATHSPTGSNLQRVPVDLLDMWAICLPAVASVSLASIHAQIHPHAQRVLPHTCVHLCYIHTPPYCTHHSPSNVTHTASHWEAAIWWFGVCFLHSLPCETKTLCQSTFPVMESCTLSETQRSSILCSGAWGKNGNRRS